MLSTTVPQSGALVKHSVFNNTFDNVIFPVRTLYCPPVPPSMLMGRYKPPPRPGRKYLNDLSLAGEREHNAQMQVARMWRGILTRRRLRNERNAFAVRTRRAIMIQCWWRCLLAKWRRRQLETLMKEWITNRRDSYVADRLKDYGAMMTWQRKRFEQAVITVQRVVRWYLCRLRNALTPDADGQREEVPFPLRHHKKVYFPWRRREKKNGEVFLEGSDKSENAQKRERASIQFRKTRKEVFPPGEDEVKAINDLMRLREAERAHILSQPEVQERLQWKRDGLLENDFDHNAGIIQRMVRYKWSGWEKITRAVTKEYFNRKVWTIQRAFRLAKTLKHIHRHNLGVERRAAQKNAAYARAKLDAIEEDIAWQFNLLNNAARTIQMMWARYKYMCQLCGPFKEIDEKAAEGGESTVPPAPPFNLLVEHIARERALRAAAKSDFARGNDEARKKVLQLKRQFVPAEIKIIGVDGKVVKTKKMPTKLDVDALSMQN